MSDHDPTYVGPEKALKDGVWIIISIGDKVVATVITTPFDCGVLERSSSEQSVEQAKRPYSFVGSMWKQTVVAGGDGESCCDIHESKDTQFHKRHAVVDAVPNQTDNC